MITRFRLRGCLMAVAIAGAAWLVPHAAGAVTPAKSEPAVAAPAKPAPKPAIAGKAVFPSAVSPKYSKETAGKARMHTCRDQYDANKATNANDGLKWIQKGGGYYSECSKHLKG